MTFETIRIDQDGPVATLTLSRPHKMNALNRKMQLELQTAFDELEQNSTIRAVIITGAGRCFSAGFDLSGAGSGVKKTIQDIRETVARENATWFKIWTSRLPYVAAVHGYCLGGACDLAMVCDITVAAQSAQFGEPEIQFQSAQAFPIMPWVIGMKKTKELSLTGDRIDAYEAERLGMVNRVVPDGDLIDQCRKLAFKLAKLPPVAVELNKQSINRGYEIQRFSETIRSGEDQFVLVRSAESEEGKEFARIAAEKGLKEAFRWRDERFREGK